MEVGVRLMVMRWCCRWYCKQYFDCRVFETYSNSSLHRGLYLSENGGVVNASH